MSVWLVVALTLFGLDSIFAADGAGASARQLGYATAWSQAQSEPAFAEFQRWSEQFLAAPDAASREAMIAEGVQLAAQRRAALAELMESDAERAIAVAVPASVRQRLPAEVAGQVETRVSGVGDLILTCAFPSRINPVFRPIERSVVLGDATYPARVYGRRASQTSKYGIPLHGLVLDGVLVLHESSLRELEPGEPFDGARPVVDVAQRGQGEPEPVLAEVGGKVYRFASREDLWEAERELEAAEAGLTPYPTQPADELLEGAATAGRSIDGEGSPDPPTAWTTGPKNVLVIRVDFSDRPGDPTFFGLVGTAEYCQDLMDNQIAPFYETSSYGMTTLSTTVTPQLYRMPQTAELYATSGAVTQLHADARAAADADYDVDSFDRIVVLFTFLGNIPGSQFTFGGLAQIVGKNVWVNGEFDFRIMSHELGHTYGVFHAALWEVTDGDPISPGGQAIEYGDDFDTMGANFADDPDTDFNPFFKNQMGWLSDAQVVTLSADGGFFRLPAFDWGNFAAAPTSPILALKFVKDSERTYWIGARRNFSSNPVMHTGAYIIWAFDRVGAGGGGGFQTAVLDMNTPGAAPFPGVAPVYDAALGIGSAFSDPAIDLLVRPWENGGVPPNEHLDILIGNASPDFGPNLLILSNFVSGGNGNGLIDFNECNNLTIVLTNNGGPATEVSAVLSSTNAGVVIVEPKAFYPNIPTNSAASNVTPFRVSTAPSFVCGTTIHFTLVVTAGSTVRTNEFSVETGVEGAPLRFANNTQIPVPDNNLLGVRSPIVVSNFTSAVGKVTVALHITTTFTADLRITLIAPDGTPVLLSQNNGGAGDNYGVGCASDGLRTMFDDDAPRSIVNGAAPFTGSYRPEQPLLALKGKSGDAVNGTWELLVADELAIDLAMIQCWSLNLTPVVCTDGGGECPGVDLALSMGVAPNPGVIGSNLTYSITVTNKGPTARNTVVTHALPPTVQFVSGITSQGTVSHAAGTVTLNLGTMNVGATATATVIGTPTQAGIITSTATVGASEPDYNPFDNSAVVTSQVLPPSSDLAVSIVDAPDPIPVGGTLTYTVTVDNNGPSTATGLRVTNSLPASVVLLSATSSQGTVNIIGNTVIGQLGTLTNRGKATMTLRVTPTQTGTLTATATARADQSDPIPGNNTATAITTVTPVADLAILLVDAPDPVVVGSNLTYTVTVANNGPNNATAVVVNQTLPASVSLVSGETTQGTFSLTDNFLAWNIGTVANGNTATLTLIVTTSQEGLIESRATVSAAQADSNPANNVAIATTLVSSPFIEVVAAGATLITESITPPNGVVEPGETVTVELRLRNAGNIGTTNLTATLLATGGVTSPSGPQTYGALEGSSLPVSRQFTFTADASNGETVLLSLQLQDGSADRGIATFSFVLPRIHVFTNSTAISIPDSGAATPYPSTIDVSGVAGLIGKVTVTLVGLSHTYPDDIDALLVGPAGQKVMLMSDAGGGHSLSGLTLTLDSAAPAALPDSGQIVAGPLRPADYEPGDIFPDPAPSGPYTTNLFALAGSDPNGEWSLFIVDDEAGDSGAVSSGWRLNITALEPVNHVAELGLSVVAATTVLVGQNLTYSYTIANSGPDAATGIAFMTELPSSLEFVSATASQGTFLNTGQTIVANLGTVASGATATVTIVANVLSAGAISTAAHVVLSEIDLYAGNNAVTTQAMAVMPLADLGVSLSAAPAPVTVGSNLTYTIILTNNGPDTAANVLVTNTFPASAVFVSAESSQGTADVAGNQVTATLGNIVAGAEATVSIVVRPGVIGLITNSVVAVTGSNDGVPANDSATVVVSVTAPAPLIAASGATLLSESFSPVNETVEPGETVTISMALENVGQVNAANLVATLQASGGVTSPSGPQTYGTLVAGGAAVARSFTFVAGAAATGEIVATLQLQAGALNLGTVQFTFLLPATATFSSSAPLLVPDNGPATPYPATIDVAGLNGLISGMTVTLQGVAHAFPDDLDILLVSPAGEKVLLMSDAGGGFQINGVTLTFSDAAATTLPDTGQIVSGTYRPTDYEQDDLFFPPAPAGPYQTLLAGFNAQDPNGTWSLFVVDDLRGDSGSIAGWSLDITTVSPVNPAADLAVTVQAVHPEMSLGGHATYHVTVVNNGPSTAVGVVLTDVLPPGAALVSVDLTMGTWSLGEGTVTCNIPVLAPGASATLTVVVSPNQAGQFINSASATAPQVDLNTGNNSAQAAVTVVSGQETRLVMASLDSGQGFQFTINAPPGQTCVVETSANLVDWAPVSTHVVPSTGTFKFTDSLPTGDARFYRVRLQ